MTGRQTKVLIFGKSGLLGGEFSSFLSADKKFKVFGYDSRECDIADFNRTQKVIKRIRPDIVINCAAKINIDRCEEEPLEAWMVNTMGSGNIARSLRLLGRKVVFLQMSTSDIFDGQRSDGYKENTAAHPVNVYGWSKFSGERIVEQELKDSKFIRYFIIRTGWLYGGFRKTFIDGIVDSLTSGKTIELVSDQFSVPTWTKDLVEHAIRLVRIKRFKSGIYHLTNDYKAPVSKYDLGIFISQAIERDSSALKKISRKKIFKATRPKYANLLNSKAAKLPHWKKSLSEYLK